MRRRADLSRRGSRRCIIKKCTHGHFIDACVSKSSCPRCEIVGIVSRRLVVGPSLCTCDLRRTCTCSLSTCALHGYCDYGMRARFLKCLQHLMGSAQAVSAHGKVVHLTHTFYFALSCPVTHVIKDRHLYWCNKGWAPSKSTHSGWCKRVTLGYHSGGNSYRPENILAE